MLAERIDEMVAEDFDDRVLAFDEVAAVHYADIVVERERRGRPMSMAEAQIAATCRRRLAAIATTSVDDFAGTRVAIVDPWSAD